ncbi:MAG TPA: RNA polymerase sigma factor [Candidatus Sulfotelmatobacter sp.]|nr:RNA polymerase sigma factor [Candidatus Sulfotelmatobacter sp.]
MGTGILETVNWELWSDEEVVQRVKAGETALYEILMRRYNQRLYRVARAILRNDAEAEDVMQDAYVRAYQHLDQFAGRAAFSTWLTRIAVNEALGRVKLRKRIDQLDIDQYEEESVMGPQENAPNPEAKASTGELRELLEAALLELPEQYRTVVMLRDVEGMTTAETAAALDLTEENVKVRLHRGRLMIRNWLMEKVGTNCTNAFPFMGDRCDRVVAAVFSRIDLKDKAFPHC